VTAASSRNTADASLKRRLLSLIYETLILAALLLAGALPVVMLTRTWDHVMARHLLQIWLLFLCGFYYVWQWVNIGQTLPMKTWRLRLIVRDGSAVTAARATLRYALAVAGTLMLGSGFLWALLDRDRHFLHDRLAGTRIISTDEHAPRA
jgi:uncharacterized RDD family membrane protein YckC